MRMLRTIGFALTLLFCINTYAQQVLKQSTAAQAIKLCGFVDSTDGNTEEAGLTIANTDIKISKNGGSFGNKNSGGATYDAVGCYTATLDATDTNTVGRLDIAVHMSGALPVYARFQVLEEAVNDAFYAASAPGYVSSQVVASVTGDIGGIAPNGLTLDAFNSDTNLLFGITRRGTAQGATGTSLQIDSGASFADDVPNGQTFMACGSTQGYCQARVATDYVGSTDTATVDTWSVTPSGTITYAMYGTAPASGAGGGLDAAGVRAALGMSSANLDTQLATIDGNVDSILDDTGSTGVVVASGSKSGYSLSSTQSFDLTGSITGNLSGSVGSVTGNVGGTVNGLTSTAQGHVRTALGVSSANLDTQLGDIPTVSEFNARTLASADYASASALSTVDTVVDAIKVTTDKLDDTLELDSTVYRFTANALEQAPAGEGGGGSSDWNSDERDAIRAILGIPASGTTPEDPTTGILDTIRDGTVNIQSRLPTALVSGRMDSSVGAMANNVMTAAAAAADLTAELQNGLATASAVSSLDGKVNTVDSVVDAIKAKTDQLTFDVTNTLNVNVTHQTDVEICGSGTDADPWQACE